MFDVGRTLLSIGVILFGSLFGKIGFEYFDSRTANAGIDTERFMNLENPRGHLSADWTPNFGNGTLSHRREARFEGETIVIHIVTYLASRPDSELIRIDRTLNDSNVSWESLDTHPDEAIGQLVEFDTNMTIVENADDRTRLVVMHWFEVGSWPTNSRKRAKLFGLWNFFRMRDDSTAIVLAAECVESCGDTALGLMALASELFTDANGNYKSVIQLEPTAK